MATRNFRLLLKQLEASWKSQVTGSMQVPARKCILQERQTSPVALFQEVKAVHAARIDILHSCVSPKAGSASWEESKNKLDKLSQSVFQLYSTDFRRCFSHEEVVVPEIYRSLFRNMEVPLTAKNLKAFVHDLGVAAIEVYPQLHGHFNHKHQH